MTESDGKLVCVIIPALHRPDLTERCISSLHRQTFPTGQYEIVVVENEARPGMSLPVPPTGNLRIMELMHNYGTTGSINRACAQTVSKYVLFINNDVELHPSFLDILVALLEKNDTYAFATGKLLNAREREHFDGAGDAIIAGGGAYRLGHGDVDCGQYDSCMHVIAGCGAATLFRRSALDEVRGLDEDFFAYLDDVDLGLRLHLHGYRGVYIPSAVGFHLGSATLGGNSLHPKIVEWLTRNQILLIVKDYPGAVLIRLLPPIFIFQLLWFIFVLAHGRIGPYLKGMSGTLRLLPKMLRKRRCLMRQRRVTSDVFLSALLSSEQQVYKWYGSQSPGLRPRFLKTYFQLLRRYCLRLQSRSAVEGFAER